MTSMLLSQITVEIKKESDSIFTDPGFIGALVGSFIAGLIAVGILWYETRSKNKESILKGYGTMKVLAARLTILNEYEKVAVRIEDDIKNYPEAKNKLCKILQNLRPSIENIYKFRERERDHIPYEFIARYHTVTNSLEAALIGLSCLSNSSGIEDVERVVKEVKVSNDIAKRFVENTQIYLKEVERKHKIKDFY
ncbi:hypothetical protein [Priestia megaterium]|uniref:hypothetical protein n=1 Tax=Priestia megaterium TaxID=1404 RepID=UPI002FFF7E2A